MEDLKEFIFENKPTESCHASTVLPLDDGRVVAAWFAGTKESADDVDILTSVRGDNGWSEPVRVSGLRDARGEVVATRIERAPGLREASAIGAVDRAGNLQGLKLGTRVAPAREVLVRGQWTGRQLEVAQTRPDPSLPFAGRVQQAVVEGLVQRTQARQLVVAGINVTLGQGTVIVGRQPATLALDQRVRVSGVLSGTHELRATRVEFQGDRIDNPDR